MIQVDVLTAILASSGELKNVIKEAIEIQDPPAEESFLQPGVRKGSPPPPEDRQSLVAQLQRAVDPGELERKERELQVHSLY